MPNFLCLLWYCSTVCLYPPPLFSKTKATKIGAPIAKRRTKPGSEKIIIKNNPTIAPPPPPFWKRKGLVNVCLLAALFHWLWGICHGCCKTFFFLNCVHPLFSPKYCYPPIITQPIPLYRLYLILIELCIN